jgi:hypothetical protein
MLPSGERLEVLSIQAKIVFFPIVSICTVRVTGYGRRASVASGGIRPAIGVDPSTGQPAAIGATSPDETIVPEQGQAPSLSNPPDLDQSTVSVEFDDYTLANGTYGARFRRDFGLAVRDSAFGCDAGSMASCVTLGTYLSMSDDATIRAEGFAILEAACAEISATQAENLPPGCGD